jgi:hypothetical protein
MQCWKSSPANPVTVAGRESRTHEGRPLLHGVTRRENVRDEEENEQEIKSLIAQAQFTIAASS